LCCSLFIEGGIFFSHGIWLLRTRKLRKAAKLAGKAFDDLPESEEYHVEVAQKGSIAASRDVEKNIIERKGSIALVREVAVGEEMLPGSVNFGRPGSVGRPLDTLAEVPSTKPAEIRVKEEEIKGEGVNTVDYGTIPRSAASGSRTRPGYVRQDSNMSTLTVFKDPQW